jgi:hypothetical protein
MQGTDDRLDLNKYIGAAKDPANKIKTTAINNMLI